VAASLPCPSASGGRFTRSDGQALIVEPTSVHSASPVRRVIRAIALAMPAVLLVAAVGPGIAGPKPTPPPEALVPSPAASASSAPSSVAPVSSPSDATGPGPARVAFPAGFGAMPALRPSAVVAARMAGATPDVVVVAGFLAIDWVDLACKDAPLGAAGPWCERRGTLYEAPIATLGNTDPGGRPPHLHLTISSLDPVAGAAAAKGPASEPVWFLRVLVGVGSGAGTSTGPGVQAASPRVAWLLLDELRLRVIASGPTAAPAGGTAAVPAAGG
jgi:hypothetical protein